MNINCEYLKEFMEKYECAEEPTYDSVTIVPFAVAEPKKVEGTDHEYEEAEFYLTVLSCKCGDYHIFPSDKTVIAQITEIITKLPECAECGPYYLHTNPDYKEYIGESVLNSKYLVNWCRYQSPKADCEFTNVDKSRQIHPFNR